MLLEGCQGKPRTPTIIEKICPNCGAEIELFPLIPSELAKTAAL